MPRTRQKEPILSHHILSIRFLERQAYSNRPGSFVSFLPLVYFTVTSKGEISMLFLISVRENHPTRSSFWCVLSLHPFKQHFSIIVAD
jgi:hypothetical protein